MEFHDFPPVTTYAAPFFVLSVALEWWGVKTGRFHGRYETKDAFTSLAMGIGNVVVNTLTATLFFWLLIVAWPYRVLTLPYTWWSFLACFVLYDFIYYWKHRFAHRARWWWMEHVTHHSSEHYNLTTALRQPWFGPFTGLYILGLPMVILGFHPYLIGFAAGWNLLYQFWIHTEAIGKLPRWIEAIMNTPSHHRVHHGRNARYLDCNYAGVFIVWDRIFGTFVPELEEERVDYGLVHNLGTFNPLRVAFHEWVGIFKDMTQRGLTLRERLMYAVAPPGWSHDGSRQTSEGIKARHLQRHPEDRGTPGFE